MEKKEPCTQVNMQMSAELKADLEEFCSTHGIPQNDAVEMAIKQMLHADRLTGNDSCSDLDNHKVLPGYNDLATKYPELIRNFSSKNERTPDTYSGREAGASKF